MTANTFTAVISPNSCTAPTPFAARREGPACPYVLEAWCCGRLEPEHAAALCAWVRSPGPWLDGYVEHIRGNGRAVVTRIEGAWSMSVAKDASELVLARRIHYLSLPHLGPDVRREGVLHVDGTHWRLCNAPDSRDVLLPYDAPSLVWHDDVIGDITTTFERMPFDALHEMLLTTLRLAGGEGHPRALEIALALAGELRSGHLYAGLVASERALDEADLCFDDMAAAIVLRVRCALESLSDRLASDELDAALHAADAACEPHARGLLLIDDELARDMAAHYGTDPGAWWAIHQGLDLEVPECALGF